MTGILFFIALLLVLSWFLAPLAWARLIVMAGREFAGLRPAWVKTEHGRWYYLEGGRGPVLLTIHGFGADADNWLRIARPLTREFRVIAPDLPGFGRSVDLEQFTFDIHSQVDRLHEFIRSLGISPVVLVGSSMGGWISAAYAARYPDNIRGLWLLAPLGVKDCSKSSIEHAIDDDIQSPFQVEGLSQFRERVLVPMFGKLPWIPFPLKVRYARDAAELGRQALTRFNELRNHSEELESIAAQLGMPVLLQWGTLDRAVDVSGAVALENALPEPMVRIQDGVGHLPMLETPAESLQFFREFCGRYKIL